MFGAASISACYPRPTRDLMVHVCRGYFGCRHALGEAKIPCKLSLPGCEECTARFAGNDFDRDLQELKNQLALYDRPHPLQAVHRSVWAGSCLFPRLRCRSRIMTLYRRHDPGEPSQGEGHETQALSGRLRVDVLPGLLGQAPKGGYVAYDITPQVCFTLERDDRVWQLRVVEKIVPIHAGLMSAYQAQRRTHSRVYVTGAATTEAGI